MKKPLSLLLRALAGLLVVAAVSLMPPHALAAPAAVRAPDRWQTGSQRRTEPPRPAVSQRSVRDRAAARRPAVGMIATACMRSVAARAAPSRAADLADEARVAEPAPAPASAPAEKPATFADIGGLWDATQVMRLEAAGVVTGDAGRFDPSRPLSRAALAAMLQRSFDPHAAGTPRPRFRDVRAGTWASQAIAAVAAAGWMRGSGGRFHPDQVATRAEAVTAVARALRLPAAPAPASSFRDATAIPAWATRDVAAATAAGIVKGFPNDTFRPDVPLNRAGAAHLLAVAYARVRPLPPAPPPPAPHDPHLILGGGHAGVAWQDVPGVIGYVVDRKAASAATWKAVARTRRAPWPDPVAAPTTAYAYRVRAVGADGRVSAPSAAVSEPALSPSEVAEAKRWHLTVPTLMVLQDVARSAPGTPFWLHGLNYRALPMLPHATRNDAGQTLVLSDDAETFHGPALLSQATVSGSVRVYYDHTNASGAPARVAVLLFNHGATTVAYTVRSRAVDAGGSVRAQGELISSVLLANIWPGARGSLRPGQGVVLDPGAGFVEPWSTVMGEYDLSLSGRVHVAVVAVRAGQNPLAEYVAHRLPPSGDGAGAGRGTFAGATRTLTLQPSASEPQRLDLADGRQDRYVTGVDELTGRRSRDYGNYGVTYRIRGAPSVPTLLVAVPLGGDYYGALDSEGRVVAAPRHLIGANGANGFLVDTWRPGQVNEFDWTPPGGSYLPLALISVPLD